MGESMEGNKGQEHVDESKRGLLKGAAAALGLAAVGTMGEAVVSGMLELDLDAAYAGDMTLKPLAMKVWKNNPELREALNRLKNNPDKDAPPYQKTITGLSEPFSKGAPCTVTEIKWVLSRDDDGNVEALAVFKGYKNDDREKRNKLTFGSATIGSKRVEKKR